MSMSNLVMIGERINTGFASSKALIERRDLNALQELAVTQVRKGAQYLTINLGEHARQERQFLIDLIQAVQAAVDVPLSFDFPDLALQRICLETFDPAKAGGRKPIVNSATEGRLGMLELLSIQPFRLVLLASERLENGHEVANESASEIAETARRLVERVLTNNHRVLPDDLLIDVSLWPLACDLEGRVQRAIEAIRLIRADHDLLGVHLMVGLSNLGIMLPKEAIDGSRLSLKLESAFLTVAMPCGLDTILGTPGRDYQILANDDLVLRTFKEAIALDGSDMLRKLQELYRKN